MTTNMPQIWHHGLVAREWAEFQTDGGKEAIYFRSLIERSGQPALDLGCGSGRLLLPCLQAGLDVDGCDFSADMIEYCQKRADKEGFAPQLYTQPMHELDLPRRYQTIFACGVVGLGGERQFTLQAMHRCYDHLRLGGSFAFDYQARWNDPPAWMARLPGNRQTSEWREPGKRKRLSDGSELELATRTVSTNPLEEIATRQIRARLWRDDALVTEEVHTQKLDDYSKNELALMLKVAGFSDIQLFGDYTDEPATADHEHLIFVAKK